MLPMGTIVACIMFAGFVIGQQNAIGEKIPLLLRKLVAVVVLAAGLWNALWYGLRHLTEFWGLAALISGILLVITAIYVLKPQILPAALLKARPLVLLALLACGVVYAVGIARL